MSRFFRLQGAALPSRPAALLLALLLLAGLCAASLTSGAVDLPALQLLLRWRPTTPPTTDETLWRALLLEVRLPRVLFAVAAGAALAVCGVAMQALFRNPLAEPGLIGVSLGGACGAVAAIVLGAQSLVSVAPAAFAGSLTATALAWRLGAHRTDPAGLVLAGVAVNALCGSLIGLFTYQADDVQLRNITFWNLGSLAAARWPLLAWLLPWTVLWSALLLREWRAMNALLLGEREAAHLGFAVAALRRRMIVLTALLVGPLVAVAGTIAFVGLVVPHLVRLIAGADHRWLLPFSLIAGALALTVADWVARVVAAPAELPIGVVTSLVGGPFLMALLARRRS
ncbi:FecCD family ABC transporter permease [Caldimonas brevitalea]|uniref:Iron ABC transporter n=1 Tax=Caldimonas brevitalea TaxID=413882 RepID=A0A0G3BKX8_9BURK|nr:iron ABC transporter permease [Caldimonas brevitalea]AKJ27195.1 iron ABC transporter [Caldimonas brevitalea]